MTKEKDIVLLYVNNIFFSFARIEKISLDIKKNWFQVKLLLLQLPIKNIVWILKKKYINGEMFTIQGVNIYMKNLNSLNKKKF